MLLRISFLFFLFVFPVASLPAQQAWLSEVNMDFFQYGDRNDSTGEWLINEAADTTLRFLDKDLQNHTVFFSGEQHTHRGTMELKLRLMDYLYRKAGVRVMVEELPYAACWLMNRYMETNNERDFSRVAKLTSHMSKEYLALLSLYHYNKGKTGSDRIILRGTDTEYAPYYTFKVLDSLRTHHPYMPEFVKQKIDSAFEFVNHRKPIFKRLYHYWKAHPEMKTVLGAEYETGLCLLRCYDCEACYASGEKTENLLVREQMMYENYVAIINEFPGKKFYSQFGDSHVCLQPDTTWYGDKHWTSIACRLDKNADSPARGQVLSMSVLTYDFNVYNTFNTPSPVAVGIWQYASQPCVLLNLADTSCPFNHMSGLTDYIFILDFGHMQENVYNANLARNDPFALTDRVTNWYNGIYVTGNYGNYTIVGGGAEVLFRELPRPLYKLQAGIGMEFNTQRKAHTFNVFATTNNLTHPFYVGAGFSATTDYHETAFFLRPEIGLQQRVLQLGYAYNFAFDQRRQSEIYEKVNLHMLFIRLTIPVWQEW